MTFLNPMNKSIKDIIGFQQFNSNDSYILSQYIYQEQIDDGWLVYNSLSKCIIKLDDNEKLSPTKELVENWFYFQTHTDQYKFCCDLKDKYKSHIKPSSNHKDYTIFTTMACNAHCPYCFENGYNRNHYMSDETALDVAKYIADTEYQHINLSWFGGEPTMNTNAIDIICSYLKNHTDKSYSSSMISNAYLFNKIGIEKMLNLWKLNWVQITLDGIYNEYNNIKNYNYHEDINPFVTVINNIQLLIDNGIKVSIRLNILPNNYMQLRDVVVYLNDRFPSNSLSIYSAPVYLTENTSHDIEYWNKVYENYINLETLINTCSVNNSKNSNGWDSFKVVNCMADHIGTPNCITPTGNLTLCEHHVTDDIVGNIYTDKMNKNIVAEYHQYNNDIESCKKCPYKPMCIYLTKCPGNYPCNDLLRQYRDYTVRTGLRDWYYNRINNAEHIDQCNRDVMPDRSVVMLE